MEQTKNKQIDIETIKQESIIDLPEPKETIETISDEVDYCLIELPSGLKINVGSKTIKADKICKLVIQLKEQLESSNQTKSKSCSYT